MQNFARSFRTFGEKQTLVLTKLFVQKFRKPSSTVKIVKDFAKSHCEKGVLFKLLNVASRLAMLCIYYFTTFLLFF